MFQGLLERLQNSVDAALGRYVTRAIVAIPFLIALAFAIAAVTIKLGELYSPSTAYAIVAAIFAAVGIIGAAGVAAMTPEPERAEARAEPASGNAARELPFDPKVLLAAIGTMGPAALPNVAKLLVRNLPMVVAALVVAYLLLLDVRRAEAATSTEPFQPTA